MRISDIKINGISKSVGFDNSYIKCSWKITDSISEKQEYTIIRLFDSRRELLYEKKGELDSAGELLQADWKTRETYTVWIKVNGSKGDSVENETTFTIGKWNEKWKGVWIGMEENENIHPLFFKNFACEKNIDSAFLHICGLGLFEAYVNGEKIGDEYLTPFLSEYQTEVQTMTYDVTTMLSKQNRMEILLGEGWYMGRFAVKREKIWGSRMALIAELHILYADGTKEVVCTDDTWKYKGSDIVFANIYDGEDIDRMKWKDKENPERKAVVLEKEREKLIDRISIPVKIKEQLEVVKVIYTPAGETVLDFGQNHTGWVQFYCQQPEGTHITLDYGEVLQNGNFYNENYRTARAQFNYVSNGYAELVRPHFTFFGYRYVRVTGWKGKLDPKNFKSCVIYSDIERTGYFETDNEKINRLYQNTIWGLKSNFLDMPTDCPQRDERLGWTGDAQVFSPTANLHMDAKAFYDKFLRDLHNYQIKMNGAVLASIPDFSGNNVTSSVWGDAATFIPMNLYQVYGDKELLRKHYPMMKEWVEYIHSEDEKRQPAHDLFDFGFHFGDWLALDGKDEQSSEGDTDKFYIASVYYYQSLTLTAQAAHILGFEKDETKYQALAKRVKDAILFEYFSPSGRLCIDTQSAYIIALKFGVYKNSEKLIEQFKKRLEKDEYKIKCGFVGAPFLCSVLHQIGMDKEACMFLFNEKYPGWLYAVNLGATTIWERWNSLLEDGSISGTGMNSLNHYSYGSIAQFMYEEIAGIKRDSVAYRSVKFSPLITQRLRYVKASYDSIYGKYVSEWKIMDTGEIQVHFEVPFGCTATAKLPYYDGKELYMLAGKHTFCYVPTENIKKKNLNEMCMKEILDDIQMKLIIEEKVPVLLSMATFGGESFMNSTLTEAISVAITVCGIDKEIVNELIEALEGCKSM